MGGCARDRASTTTPNDAAPAADDGTTEETEAAVVRPAPGVAHSANIDQVVLDPSGTAALSRDTVGGLRLWTALDGSAEPRPVPVAAPRSFATLRTEQGFVVLVVEGSGGARFVAMRADGTAETIASLPPFNPVLEVLSLGTGEDAYFAALMKDGAVRVFDPAGTERAVFDEKEFQPLSLRASDDGKHLLAVTTMVSDAGFSRSEVQRLTFEEDGDGLALRRSGVPQIVRSIPGIQANTVAFSPDGSEVAVLVRSVDDAWEIALFDLAVDEKPRTVAVTFARHQQPWLGYAGPHSLLVSSQDGTPSQLVDTKTTAIRLRSAIPQDFNHQGRVQDVGAGRQIVAYGTFLFVQDVDARRHRFLGYTASMGSGVGLSPAGTSVAWAYAQGPVVVESIDGTGPAVELEVGPNNHSGTRVRFLDEEHVVIVDAVGELSLVHWPTKRVVANAGSMGNVRAVRFDAAQGVMAVERHANEAWVFEVSVEDGFVGPYIVNDALRVSLLRPSPPSDEVLWTLQATSNKFRTYTLDQLRADLTLAEAEALSVELQPGHAPPLAVDAQGKEYGVRWNGTGLELFIAQGETTSASRAIASNDVNQILPSPRGDRFLAVLNQRGSISVVMHDSETAEAQWSHATGEFSSDVVWSDDGRFVALSGNTGAVLLDVRSGERVRSRCGLRFASFGSPPANAFSSPNVRSICEP